MFPVLAIDVETNASSTLFWAWGAATLLLSTALGFFAGQVYANRSRDWQFKNAIQSLSSLYHLVLDSLDKAQHVAGLLDKFPDAELSVEDLDRLEAKRGSLFETIAGFVRTRRETIAEAKRRLETKPKQQAFQVAWQRTTLDSATGLPDRPAFEANLRMLLEAGTRAGVSSGLLLLKIDRMDQLKARFGLLGADVFVKTMAAVIARAVREHDLTCRLSADSFAILYPSVDPEAGRKLSQAVRNSVRLYTFRLDDTGPEVLVTASFGYTHCGPGEKLELVLTRAANALDQSMRRGRNQLHAADGESVVLCTTG